MEEKETFVNKQSPIKVFVKRNKNGEIIDINSEIFINNLDEWEYFDEGFGDKFAHAQSQYFEQEKNSVL